MGKLRRYYFAKKLYPNYLIFLIVKGKYVTYELDAYFVNYLGFNGDFKLLERKKINYILIDELEIVSLQDYDNNNQYYKYLWEFELKKVVKMIGNYLTDVC